MRLGSWILDRRLGLARVLDGVRSRIPPHPATAGAGTSDGGSAWDTAVAAAGPAHFRPDIEGLRAVAILAVLAYHAGVPGLPGGFVGVDVFFVISGYLITGLLLREYASDGRINLAAFYARRARRLLPAALVVIAATLALSAVVLSELRFPDVAGDGAAAALYVSNYRFALNATDYFAAGQAPSPLLHYWSLAVEEQFYLFWPLLILTTARLWSVRRLSVVMGVLAVASLGLSIKVTDIEPPWAFYSLPTRAWQLALGGLVGVGTLALPARWSPRLSTTLGLLGIGLIVAASVLINDSTPFPGSVALLPAGGAAMVIMAGERSRGIVTRLLSTRLPRWLGRISYSLYLWHWPLLILLPTVLDRHGLRTRLVLAAVAVLVAWLSTKYIEAPLRVRRSALIKARRTLLLSGGASCMIAMTAVVMGAQPGIPTAAGSGYQPTMAPESSSPPAALTGRFAGPVPEDLTPSLLAAHGDKAKVLLDGCYGPNETGPGSCIYGVPDGNTTVVLFGDSHAGMWLPAIEAVGRERSWRILAFVKPSCTPADVNVWSPTLRREFRECRQWRQRVLQRLSEIRPSIIFVSTAKGYTVIDEGGHLVPATATPAWEAGLQRTLTELRADARRVVLIGNTPHPSSDAAECLAERHLIELCTDPPSTMIDSSYRTLEADAAAAAGVGFIDPIDWLCTESGCPLILGHYFVYRDTSHITATIATVLAPNLRWQLDHLP